MSESHALILLLDLGLLAMGALVLLLLSLISEQHTALGKFYVLRVRCADDPNWRRHLLIGRRWRLLRHVWAALCAGWGSVLLWHLARWVWPGLG